MGKWIAVGTVLQTAMVLVGHRVVAVANLFGPLGVAISLLVGLLWAREASTGYARGAGGGAVVGGVCALVGILISFLLGDVTAAILALGTLSSAVTGALGGLVGHKVRAPSAAAAVGLSLLALGSVQAAAQQHPAHATSADGGAALGDFAWLEGTWRGPAPDGSGTAEIHFMAPEAGVLPSFFRLWEGDRVLVLEAITLVADEEGLVMYVRHFDPALVPLEEEHALALRLVGREGDGFVFENMRAGDNPVRSVMTPTPGGFVAASDLVAPDGTKSEIRVEYERAGSGAAAGDPTYSDARLAEGVLEWSVVLDAPVEGAWAAFTDEAAMEGWMAPAVEVDFRIGGLMRSNYDPEAGVGGPGTIESEILAYEPERMLAMRTVTVPDNAPQAKAILDAWSVTYFEPVGPGRTRVTLRSLGWGEGPEWDRARDFFAEGNLYVLRKLRSYLEGRP